MSLRNCVTALVVSVMVACAPGEKPRAVTVSRDSAGITIVENRLSSSAPVPDWTLTEPPLVQLGAVERDRHHQFNNVVSALRLKEGRIVVADRGSGELRFFDADGEHILTVGGRGKGPGEFRYLRWVNRQPGDTLVASDWPVGELSWFDDRGTFIRRERIGFYWPGLAGELMEDGSMITDVWEKRSYGNEIEWVGGFGDEGPFRPSGHLVRVIGDSTNVDTLRTVLGEEWFKHGQPRAGLAMHTMPFARTTRITWINDRVYVGETGTREIEVLRLDGSLERLIRWEEQPSPVTGADRVQFRTAVLKGLRQPHRRPDYERWLAAVPFPSEKPAFKTMTTDRAGQLWVAAWSDAEAEDDRWMVFDSEGALFARVETPAGLELLEIGDDYVLALWRDELDVEYVRLYDLERTT